MDLQDRVDRVMEMSEQLHKEGATVSDLDPEQQEAIKCLINGRFMSPDLMTNLANKVFRGSLITNRYLSQCCSAECLPPRLPLFLAAMARHTYFEPGEIL